MNMWDERYSSGDFAFGTTPNDFLATVCDRIPAAGRVLCLGDGEGRNGVHLAQQGYSVTSVDQSGVGLEKARELASGRGLDIATRVADLAEFSIEPGTWEGIVSIFCHLPAPLRRQVYRQAAAGLRPGGAFILESYIPRQLEFGTGGPRSLDLLPSLEDLRADLEDLRFEHALETERDVVEGRYHTGRAAVVQIVAIKP